MRISVALFLLYILIIGIHAKKDCKERLQRCENKKPPHRKQVCGTDNKTYPNRCALLREQCTQNSPLTVKHEGKCREKQPCWMDQGKKMTKNGGKNSRNGPDYTPECLEDGTYAPRQCHIGYCWCVTSNGRIIPGTSARHRKIECSKRARLNAQNGDEAGNSSKIGCDQTNRSIFTKNLVRIFKTEYNRRDTYGGYYPVPETFQNITNVELRAIDWKFTSLDTDKNNSLSKSEYKDLRGLIRKAVKPKRCSRKFIRLCDVDRNAIITKQEWINCLNISNTDEREEENTTKLPLQLDDSSEDTEPESEEVDVPEPQRDPARVLEESALPLYEHTQDAEKEQENKINDCFSDRKSVLDEQKLGNQPTYIPECAEDGRYKKVQCFPSTGYCWCVMEESGKPIPGTSAQNSTPKCDVVPPLITGCPDHKRIAFIKSLIEFFHRNLSNSTPVAEQLPLSDKNGQEQIVNRGFHSLDTNKNKALDRKEWKVFRSMVATINKNLKKCGRKFLRYCDADQDNKVSLNEWLQCTNTQNINSLEIHSNPSNIRRRGPNPLESYLKGDD